MKKLLRCCLIGCFLAAGFFAGSGRAAEEPKKEVVKTKIVQGTSIELTVAVVLDAPGPTLAFTMTNVGKAPTPALRILQSPSCVVIVNPDGKEWVDFATAGPPLHGTKIPMLAPGETTKPDKLNIYEWLSMSPFKQPGLYRVYSKIVQQEGDDVVEYKSNEVLILWEKGTPPLNMTTGLPEPE